MHIYDDNDFLELKNKVYVLEKMVLKEPNKNEVVDYKSLFSIAREFWKVCESDIDGVGQQTSLLAKFGAYILNNEKEIRDGIKSASKRD